MAWLASLFVAVHLHLSCNPSLGCPSQQKRALLQFKHTLLTQLALNDSPNALLAGLENWDSSLDCCEWELVTCRSSRSLSKQVTDLNLNSLLPSLAYTSNATLGVVSSHVLTPLFSITSLFIDLSFNLVIGGEIPVSGFRNLTNLAHLDLKMNQFNGSIPEEMFSLRNLRYLDMSSNSFVDTLSSAVGGLRNLKFLNLDENFLHGNIPVEIGYLAKLHTLSLRQNQFSGGISSVLLNLIELDVLDLRNIAGEIPPNIGNLAKLSTLALSRNSLTGGIPGSIQMIINLTTLELNNNLLSGKIPAWLFDLEMLKILNLGGNKLMLDNPAKLVPKCRLSLLVLRSCGLKGLIPRWILNQTSLDFLDLSENELEGSFLLWLAEMEIGSIILSDNKLSGSLPPRLFQSESLSVLALSRNNFSGELPETIGESQLMILMLSDNNFSGQLPQSLPNIYRLLLLNLSKNNLSGNKLPTFNPNFFLAFIDLSSNRFYGEISTGFGPGVIILSLGENQFSGLLPENLTNFTQLKHLDLHDNNISGEIPSFLSSLSSLQTLSLRNNSLTGSIPSDLANLTHLQILDLSNNKLVGDIPSRLGDFPGMINSPDTSTLSSALFSFDIKFQDLIVNWKSSKQGLSKYNLDFYSLLDLSNNELTNQIPSSLGGLETLKLLNLSHNALHGRGIPVTFTKLQQLTTLDLSNNKLKGRIPERPQLNTLNDPNMSPQLNTLNDPHMYANNSGLCGVPIRVACPDDALPVVNESGEQREKSFSWQAAGIGVPVGFIIVVSSMYIAAFFNIRTNRRSSNRARSRSKK
ncbi:probable LRR receptor-like serine/threonine-protein kinase At1g34110 [Chenopodium quinoa]|uniref:probable LRR receptor-like serine/threonine-protein kinase At1g34110 n=1 Tax=Chenopodium quinoa TaxID=63459 RepID=UPI000B795A80|nr:probable LRR receptor-like serine/threonine-protein kinase At1g34110 [Chenopodium quinoa]